MAKVINAVFGGGLFATTAKVFQYDVGDKLRFLGVDLPAGYSVDFANSRTGASTTVYGDADGVTIPPEYFIPGTEIYAWVVISDADGHYTRYQAKIPIYERAARSSVEPTPAQADALDDAINALNSATQRVEDIADDLNEQIDQALAEAKASGEFDGEDGYSPTVTVTEIEGGHRVTITDKSGDHVFDVMDGQGSSITVDSSLSSTSENPVQNKAIYSAFVRAGQEVNRLALLVDQLGTDLNNKADVDDIPDLTGYATQNWVTSQGYLDSTALGNFRTIPEQDVIDAGKLDIAQGTDNVGKFLVVGSDGNITTVTMTAWQGGSY